MTHIRIPNRTQLVMQVLTHEWQTASLIAGQITFPPDAIAREMARQRGRDFGLTEAGAKTSFVAQVIHQNMRRKNKTIEKRRNDKNKFEYRLIKQP